ncbi:hypothetical protein [Paenibacillus sp. B1-33]|uniref:hypothetical protein n=1 Tax=unclassified Paenibacillus TaxID=185978 RepID=UPI003D2BD5EE
MKDFKKMDEMEKYISSKSVFWTYTYMVTFLAVWIVINLLNKMSVTVPLFLFISQILLQSIIRSTLKKKMNGGDEE